MRTVNLKNRALTDEDKRKVIEDLYSIWIKNPKLRLTQLIANVIEKDEFFYLEDFSLIRKLKQRYEDDVKQDFEGLRKSYLEKLNALREDKEALPK